MKLKRKLKTSTFIPVSSMADIAFLLLIFFMLTSMISIKEEISVSLPKTDTVEKNDNKFFSIWINREKQIIYNNKSETSSNIIDLARSKAIEEPQITVVIKADETVEYEYIDSIIKAMQKAGVFTVTLAGIKK